MLDNIAVTFKINNNLFWYHYTIGLIIIKIIIINKKGTYTTFQIDLAQIHLKAMDPKPTDLKTGLM